MALSHAPSTVKADEVGGTNGMISLVICALIVVLVTAASIKAIDLLFPDADEVHPSLHRPRTPYSSSELQSQKRKYRKYSKH